MWIRTCGEMTLNGVEEARIAMEARRQAQQEHCFKFDIPLVGGLFGSIPLSFKKEDIKVVNSEEVIKEADYRVVDDKQKLLTVDN